MNRSRAFIGIITIVFVALFSGCTARDGTETGSDELLTAPAETTVSVDVSASAETDPIPTAYTVRIAASPLTPVIDITAVPEYNGEPYIDLEMASDLELQWDLFGDSYAILSPFDSLGRTGPAMMIALSEGIPEDMREPTGTFKPTGWVQNKYPDIIDSTPPYLYNRAHLLMWAMSGITDVQENLFTGTRYLNVSGMLPTETVVINRAKGGKEVLYRVTPVYAGDDLLAYGVLMEAVSRDGSFRLCRFAYNVQPGIEIDYATGDNHAVNEPQEETEPSETQSPSREESQEPVTLPPAHEYVLNTNTHKFHEVWCSSVDDIKEKNKKYFTGDRQEIIDEGYVPCMRCNP